MIFRIRDCVTNSLRASRNSLTCITSMDWNWIWKYVILLSLILTNFYLHIASFYSWNFVLLFQFPTCLQTKDCAEERESYAKLVEELSKIFKPRKWLLSAVVSTNPLVMDNVYDVPKMSKYLDWFSMMVNIGFYLDYGSRIVAPRSIFDFFNQKWMVHVQKDVEK